VSLLDPTSTLSERTTVDLPTLSVTSVISVSYPSHVILVKADRTGNVKTDASGNASVQISGVLLINAAGNKR
jgi:hypothetical protein